MSLLEAFLQTAPALMKIFSMGVIPCEDDFYELTPEQYEKFERQFGKPEERIFMLLPKNPRYHVPQNEVEILPECQIEWFNSAVALIERYCRDSEKPFRNDEEKLYYVATRLPSVFSEGSKYQPPKLRVLEKNE